ncbi:hypothetical protein AB5I41_18730 [Sphingomonas sp. MMS24-JH45]
MPISVSAFQQEELTEKGIVGFEGIARETPGVILNRPTQNFNNFTAVVSPPTAITRTCRARSRSISTSCRSRPSATRQWSTEIRFDVERVDPARAAGDAVRFGLAVGRNAHPDQGAKPQQFRHVGAGRLRPDRIGQLPPALQSDGQRADRQRQAGGARGRLLSQRGRVSRQRRNRREEFEHAGRLGRAPRHS